jgi:hypothetical protein
MNDRFNVIVPNDHMITSGSPEGRIEHIATFRRGEELELRKVSDYGDYPDMYEINGHQDNQFSRGVLCTFLPGFERSTTASV